ncbi:MAG: hypothetical protein ACOH1Q_07760 [Thiobacillus sp.]
MSNSDEVDEFFDRPHDYCRELLFTGLSGDWDMIAAEAERLDFILNRYFVGQDKDSVAKLQAARKAAPKLLHNLAADLNHAVARITELEDNPYASSALFSELPEKLNASGDHIDSLIERFEDLINATKFLAAISLLAAERQNYSNGLPEFQRGAQADPLFDDLVHSTHGAVIDIIKAGAARQGNDQLKADDAHLQPARLAAYIQQVLYVAGIEIKEKSIYNRISKPFPPNPLES